MGFDINETIKTELHYKDIALITVMAGDYQRRFKKTASPDILERLEKLVNRLGYEMSDIKQTI